MQEIEVCFCVKFGYIEGIIEHLDLCTYVRRHQSPAERPQFSAIGITRKLVINDEWGTNNYVIILQFI